MMVVLLTITTTSHPTSATTNITNNNSTITINNNATNSINNNPCSAASFFLTVQPVPWSCRHYVLCYHDRVLREVPCAQGAAFSLTKRACVVEEYEKCQGGSTVNTSL
jgi:hypothetical protein